MTEPVRFLESPEGPNGDLAATLLRSAAALDADEARQRKDALLAAAAAGAAGIGLASSKGLLHGAGIAKWLWMSAIGAVVLGAASVPFWWERRDAAPDLYIGAPDRLRRPAPQTPDPSAPVNAGTGSATQIASATADKPGASETGPAKDLAPEPPSSGAAPTTAAAAAPTAAAVVKAPAASAHAPSAPGSGLAEELAALRRAREALTGGRAVEALSLLDSYSARFPAGRLSAEASVLRIDALWAAGRREEAAQRARRWLANHPKSPYAARLRAIVGESSP